MAIVAALGAAHAQAPSSAPAPSATPLPTVPVEPPAAQPKQAPPAVAPAPAAQSKAAVPAPKQQAAPKAVPKAQAKAAPKQAPPPAPTVAPEPVAEGPPLPPGVVVNPALPVQATTAGPVQGYRALTGSTSTRTETPVERIPQSISIIPRSVIDDQRPVGTSEALQNVSGVVPASPIITPAFDPTLLRGFSADRWVDGLSIQYNPGDTQGTINIERIEVLTLVAHLRDADYAKALQLLAEYQPAPPFNAGTPEGAGPAATGMMTAMFTQFVADARAAAEAAMRRL